MTERHRSFLAHAVRFIAQIGNRGKELSGAPHSREFHFTTFLKKVSFFGQSGYIILKIRLFTCFFVENARNGTKWLF